MWENCFYVGGSDDGTMRAQDVDLGAALCWELMRTHPSPKPVVVVKPGDTESGRLSLIHISEPTRRVVISYAVFCLKKNFFNDTATTEIYTV